MKKTKVGLSANCQDCQAVVAVTQTHLSAKSDSDIVHVKVDSADLQDKLLLFVNVQFKLHVCLADTGAAATII